MTCQDFDNPNAWGRCLSCDEPLSAHAEQLVLPNTYHDALSEALTLSGLARGPVTRMTDSGAGGYFQAPALRPDHTMHGKWSVSPVSGRVGVFACSVILDYSADDAWATVR